MTTKRWKVFYDHEKEEKWLNKMVAEGLAMTNYRLYRYTFEECSRNDTTYLSYSERPDSASVQADMERNVLLYSDISLYLVFAKRQSVC